MTATPTHCSGFGRSCMKTVAIEIVHSGLLARIGAAIDIGKCLRAKDAKIHELPAMIAFENNCPCAVHDSAATLRVSNGIESIDVRDKITNGSQINADVITLKNSTGGTAFSRTDTFLAIS